jgi:hypothetical protein
LFVARGRAAIRTASLRGISPQNSLGLRTDFMLDCLEPLAIVTDSTSTSTSWDGWLDMLSPLTARHPSEDEDVVEEDEEFEDDEDGLDGEDFDDEDEEFEEEEFEEDEEEEIDPELDDEIEDIDIDEEDDEFEEDEDLDDL